MLNCLKQMKFNQSVADQINENYNTSYSASTIKHAIKITPIENTAMFKIVVTTTNADLSLPDCTPA